MQKRTSDPVPAPTALKRFQFSFPGMFWMVTSLAIFLGLQVEIWRRTVRSIEANNRRAAFTIRANDLQLYERQLALLKSSRERSPASNFDVLEGQIEKQEADSRARLDAAIEKLGPDLAAP